MKTIMIEDPYSYNQLPSGQSEFIQNIMIIDWLSRKTAVWEFCWKNIRNMECKLWSGENYESRNCKHHEDKI